MIEALAGAPTRATNNIMLRLGLMGLPVQLFNATEDTKTVERHTYDKVTDAPIGYLKINKVTAKPVTEDEITYKVEFQDKLLELTDDEILAATAGAAIDKGSVDVDEFIPLSALGDSYLVDTSRLYQVRPAPREVKRTKFPDPIANKLFVLLMEAMKRKDVGALIRLGLRSHARHAVLCPDGYLRFVFYPDEVRAALPVPLVEIEAGELAQVEALIDALTVDSAPEIRNNAREAIQAYLQKKAAGELPAVKVPTNDEPEAQVLDLSALLAASVEAAKIKKAS